MPIHSWLCNVNCGGRERPLDHFETTDCGDCTETGKGLHPDFAAAVLEQERAHYRFGKRAIGVTDLVSGCPRAAAIKHTVPYAVDPLALNSPMTGMAYHQYIALASNSKEVEVKVAGKVEGVEVITSVDRLRKHRLLIEDHKHRNDYAGKYDKRDGSKAEHVAQLSLGAELVEQTLGWRPMRGTIWAHYTGAVGLYPMPVPTLLSLSDVLEFKPWKGDATVRDHLAAMERWRKGEMQWSDLPLFGEAQKIGDKTACDYCPARVPCWEQARGAAF